MDEPFGAVDPIARDRLQEEFLRLQAEVRKTVVIVTHDIDEAVRLGDRIAVLRQGGCLEQYADPANVLDPPRASSSPSFVGADRGLRRLEVTPILSDDLARPPVLRLTDPLATARASLTDGAARWAVVLDGEDRLRGWIGSGQTDGDGTVGERVRRMEAWVPHTATLREAMAVMLEQDSGWVAVLDGDRFLGVFTPATVHRRAAQLGRRGRGAHHPAGGRAGPRCLPLTPRPGPRPGRRRPPVAPSGTSRPVSRRARAGSRSAGRGSSALPRRSRGR